MRKRHAIILALRKTSRGIFLASLCSVALIMNTSTGWWWLTGGLVFGMVSLCCLQALGHMGKVYRDYHGVSSKPDRYKLDD